MGSSRLFPTGWIIVNPLAHQRAIGDPCALMRWQDHHNRCGGLFIVITTYYITQEMFCMALEKNGRPTAVEQQQWHALNTAGSPRSLKSRGKWVND
jgi:hypothetical protein